MSGRNMVVNFKWAILFLEIIICSCHEGFKLKIVTVATDETDGYLRFMRSAEINKLDVEVFGLHQEWLGGDLESGPGGGHKLNLLREGLKKYKDAKDLILMFTDSYDVVLASDESEIMEKFMHSGANILISAEDFIWPDQTLAGRYPVLEEDGYRYLCSGGIIGYAPALYKIISLKAVGHTDDDQLYYTHIYLEDRERYNIKLDRRANLFQNLNGNKDHVDVKFNGSDVRIFNTRFNTTPAVIHGNGPSKLYLNYLGNYVPKRWTIQDGCLSCEENKIDLESISKEEWPTVFIGIFIPSYTPFIAECLRKIFRLDYPKNKIDIFIYNAHAGHENDVEAWVDEFGNLYKSVSYKEYRGLFSNEFQFRNFGIFLWKKVKSEYYFSLDSAVTLWNNKTLQILIEQNRTILVPKMSKYLKLWSNFWGDITADGYYARQNDYLDIVQYNRSGVWNSPHITIVYLMNSTVMDKIGDDPFTFSPVYDPDMQFCANLRKKGIFMYATNLVYFGHIKETATYNPKLKHNDLYQLFDNKLDWEEKYLHLDYDRYLADDSVIPQPCPDVYYVPIATEAFAKELIEECEHYGQWSGGKNEDTRLASGYEAVPTVDIHMNQIGFEKHWLHMLEVYFSPMATRVFWGYYSENKAIMNFVVKYTLDGQYHLRPHHDISTYTVNMALNRGDGVDYDGGGSRFIRYNCSATNLKVGWALLHPGRLTHQHEGLPITKGTRYIMISFVDP